MAILNISVSILDLSKTALRFIPGNGAGGSFVGDIYGGSSSMFVKETVVSSGTDVGNVMSIGGIVQRLSAAGGLQFSRPVDMYSVDIAEAYHNQTPAAVLFEFSTGNGLIFDTATLVISVDKISGYISHSTNIKNIHGGFLHPPGFYERIGLTFEQKKTNIFYGRKLDAMAAAIILNAQKVTGSVLNTFEMFLPK